MIGDRLLIKPHHRRAAAAIARRITPLPATGPHVVTIAGESGSGKSETAAALADHLAAAGVGAAVLQQDDYFVHPPRTNHQTRLRDISWVGPREVRLDLLAEHLGQARAGKAEIRKPLVIYEEDRVTEETLDLTGVQVLIAEGTYTSLLPDVDTRVFLDLTYHETKRARLERAREEQDDFLERVLEIEHRIISAHKARADLIVDRHRRVTERPR
jgi:uridine kinase